MRKRPVPVWMAAWMVCAFCLLWGCAREPDQERFSLVIAVQCETPVYGLHCEYYLRDKPIGGQEVGYSPSFDKPMEKGEELAFSFTAFEFPEDADLGAFGFELFAILDGQKRSLAGELNRLPATYGEEYRFQLTESAGRFALKQEN